LDPKGGPASEYDFCYDEDHAVFGDNKYHGNWKQNGRSIVVITEDQEHTKWQGEVDETGKTMTITCESGMVAKCRRRIENK
jgi:hypothetical protein